MAVQGSFNDSRMNTYDLKELLDALDTARIYAGAEFEKLCNNHEYIDACMLQAVRDSIARNIQILQSYVINKAERPSVNPQPKTGHWIEENINEWSRKVFCSECGCPPPFEHVNNGDVYSASGYGVTNKTKYCPNCGCRMVEMKENEDKE